MPPYEGSYSGSDEEQILTWAAELTKQPALGSAAWPDALRDGVALCELANALRPNTVPKVSRSSMPFPQRENVPTHATPAVARVSRNISDRLLLFTGPGVHRRGEIARRPRPR